MTSLKLVTANIKFYKWYSLFFIFCFFEAQLEMKNFSLFSVSLLLGSRFGLVWFRDGSRNKNRERAKHSFDGKTFSLADFHENIGWLNMIQSKDEEEEVEKRKYLKELECFSFSFFLFSSSSTASLQSIASKQGRRKYETKSKEKNL